MGRRKKPWGVENGKCLEKKRCAKASRSKGMTANLRGKKNIKASCWDGVWGGKWEN